MYGKSQEIESEMIHNKHEYEKLISFICSKILSEKEIEELFNGKDFYFNGEEAIKRLKQYAGKKLKEQKEINKKKKSK